MERDARGHLWSLMRICELFTRPEIAPIDESCHMERALHAELLGNPHRAMPAAEIHGRCFVRIEAPFLVKDHSTLRCLATVKPQDNVVMGWNYLGKTI